MNGAPSTSMIETRSSARGPDRPASPAKRLAAGATVDKTLGSGGGSGSVAGSRTRPASSVIRRSARAINSGSWVAKTTPTPAARAATTTPATADHVNRSWPTLGSSRTRTVGPWAMAPASASRLCSPPERQWGSTPDSADRPSTSSRASTRAWAASSSRPSRLLVDNTSSRTVRATTTCSACCGTHPNPAAKASEVQRSTTSRDCRPMPCDNPSPARTSPWVGASTPASSAVRVDLPAPLGPTTATHCPARTSAHTSCSASTGLARWLADITDSRAPRTTETDSAATSTDPGRPKPARPARLGMHNARGTCSGRGAATDGTQTPWAARWSAELARVMATGPSALTLPAESSTTKRSTSCTQSDS